MDLTPNEQRLERLFLFALGALEGRDMEEIDRAIASGEIPAAMVADAFETTSMLAIDLAASMPKPRRALKDQILAHLDVEPTGPDIASGRQQLFVLQNDGEWVDLFEGIRVKILWRDQTTGQITFLASLAPGANYPSHRHMGIEECLVIEGDLRMDDSVLGAGEYTVAFADNVHRVTRTESGCLLLLRSPMNDEFLEDVN